MYFRVYKSSQSVYPGEPIVFEDREFATLEDLMGFIRSVRGRHYACASKEALPLECIVFEKDGVDYIEIYDDYRE